MKTYDVHFSEFSIRVAAQDASEARDEAVRLLTLLDGHNGLFFDEDILENEVDPEEVREVED